MFKTVCGPLSPNRLYPAMLEPLEPFNPHVATQNLTFGISQSHFWIGLVFGLIFLVTGPAVAVIVTAIMIKDPAGWLNWQNAGYLSLVWLAALISLAVGWLMISTEYAHLGFRRSVQFTETGVEVTDIDKHGRLSWSSPYAAYAGVVLTVTYGELESGHQQRIELRHGDPAKTLSLHRSQGSGLHPDMRRLTCAIAARIGLKPSVEINKVLVPLGD